MPLVRKVINNQVVSNVGTILNIPYYLYLRNDNNFDVGVSENEVYQVYPSNGHKFWKKYGKLMLNNEDQGSFLPKFTDKNPYKKNMLVFRPYI